MKNKKVGRTNHKTDPKGMPHPSMGSAHIPKIKMTLSTVWDPMRAQHLRALPCHPRGVARIDRIRNISHLLRIRTSGLRHAPSVATPWLNRPRKEALHRPARVNTRVNSPNDDAFTILQTHPRTAVRDTTLSHVHRPPPMEPVDV